MKDLEPKKIVLIGASTGGPGQIEKIISSLEILTETTIIIAQHMVDGFVPSFATRLKENNINKIGMAEDGAALHKANIYLCDGLTTIKKNSSGLYFSKKPSSLNQYNPDINLLFNSFVPFSKNIKILAVILTGIGDDGVDGCKNLTLNGAMAITENQTSAIVDGMPSRARSEVENIQVSDIEGIITRVKEFCI